MNWIIIHHPWPDLNLDIAYDILRFRQAALVVEQASPYADIDGRDPFCYHFIAYDGDNMIGYARAFGPGDGYQAGFGRLVVAPCWRNSGIGKALVKECLNWLNNQFPDQALKISAQHYLIDFYQDFGFSPIGDVYDDAGIAHLDMHKPPLV